MASLEDNRQSKTDSGSQSFDSNTNTTNQTPTSSCHQPPPPPPPQPNYQHPPHGYPPHVMGYPGYPGYPPNGPYNHQQYPYTQPPPAAYYGSQPYPTHQPQPVYRPTGASVFCRGILAALIFLVFLSCISSIITWIALRPEMPTFTLQNFTIRNINLSGPVFSADWTADVMIDNPNTKLKAYFDRIQTYVYYEDENDYDDYLSMSKIAPIFLDIQKNANVVANQTTGPDDPPVPIWVMEDMKKEKESGIMTFDFRMVVWSTLKSNGWWKRDMVMKVFCEKLRVSFTDKNGGDGAIATGGKPVDCIVFV